MKNVLLAFLVLLTAGPSGCSGLRSGNIPVANTGSRNIQAYAEAVKLDNSANHATIRYELKVSPTNSTLDQPNLEAEVNRGFEPPVSGNVELQFSVVNHTGQPVKDADLEVLAEHANMSSMTIQVKAVDRGAGRYTVDANFSMPGLWKVTFEVKKGSLEHRQAIMLKII